MDKRREARFTAEQCVTIATLGEHPFHQTARIRNASGSGLGLFVQTEISPGTALRIELPDAVILGEAMYSRPVENGYFVGVQLEQMLSGLGDLRRRLQAFQDERVEDLTETR